MIVDLTTVVITVITKVITIEDEMMIRALIIQLIKELAFETPDNREYAVQQLRLMIEALD